MYWFPPLRREWDTEVYCADACGSGYALCTHEADIGAVAYIWRQQERCRYKNLEGESGLLGPRGRALQLFLHVRDDPQSLDVLELGADFREVPASLLTKRWGCIRFVSLFGYEGMYIKECRALLCAVRGKPSKRKHWGSQTRFSWR